LLRRTHEPNSLTGVPLALRRSARADRKPRVDSWAADSFLGRAPRLTKKAARLGAGESHPDPLNFRQRHPPDLCDPPLDFGAQARSCLAWHVASYPDDLILNPGGAETRPQRRRD